MKEEVIRQARRLSWHPSMAIWGGNNEIEASFDWNAEARQNAVQRSVDFAALFLDTVRVAVDSVCPELPFVDTSPANGLLSSDPYVKR